MWWMTWQSPAQYEVDDVASIICLALPGTGRSRGLVEPHARMMASVESRMPAMEGLPSCEGQEVVARHLIQRTLSPCLLS